MIIPVTEFLPDKIPDVEPEEEECLNLTLKRAGEYILRQFEDEYEESEYSSLLE